MDPAIIDFEWLTDLQKSQCFTTCELSNSAKSFDFGAAGFTASVSDWHELLQITAPDKTCGIVFVRGNFPNTADAILSRAQRRDDSGNKGSFGARLVPATFDTDLELGVRRAHGLVNLRLPYSQYELKRKDGIWDGNSGTYEEISFVRDRTVFHVVRIKWGSGTSLSDYDSTDAAEKRIIKIKSGGYIQFGCPCSNGGPPDSDNFTLNTVDGDGTLLSCASERYQKRLDMRLFINGQLVHIAGPLAGVDNDEIRGSDVNVSRTHKIELSLGEPTVIMSTYALRDLDEDEDNSLPDFESLQDELGISNTSVNMTDRLWTALCSRNYEASEAVESCVIGRCVEQILCVSSVPFSKAAMGSHNSVHSSSGDEVSDEVEDNKCIHEIALLCNIIGPQYVDVQSTFFQIRLLAKAYDFILTRHLEPDLFQRHMALDSIRAAYLEKLLRHIQSTLAWLVNSNLSPGRLLLALSSDREDHDSEHSERLDQCEKNRVKMNIDRSYNQACYATLAVWYVMKYCSPAMTDEFKTWILLPKLNKAYESVQKRASRDKDPTPKNDLLQWHHLNCLLLICNKKFKPEDGGQAVDGFTAAGLDRHELMKTQQKFEKYVARLKANQSDSYTLENEELDRLLLLGEELGLTALDTEFSSSLANARALHTRKIITRRKRTTRFNPGPIRSKGIHMVSNGPWELQCLNHQMYLSVADESNVKGSRDRLFEFLLSDYSFMTSWDRSDSQMISKWWDIEPTAVICVTLLDLKQKGKLKAAKSQTWEDLSQSFHDAIPADQGLEGLPKPGQDPDGESSIREILLQMKQSQEESSQEHLNQIRQLLSQDDAGVHIRAKPFDWISCKPTHIYHPLVWAQSLTDSPDAFKAKQTKDVVLRKNARLYFAGRDRSDIIKEPEYTLANIRYKVPAEDVQFLSVFDLSLNDEYDFGINDMSIKSVTSANQPSSRRRGTVTVRRASAPKQPSNAYSLSQLDEYRKVLFGRLNDSLMDLGTKYRILFTEKCSPSLVGSFIYLWHPDALDTFDSYFSSSSRFSDTREANTWLTTITISHWSIKPTSLSPDHIERFRENRNNGDFPPVSIARLGYQDASRRSARSTEPTDIVEERCSSLVITGDPSGYLWVCSIWSSLTDSESLLLPVQSVLPTLQCFLHQQACGRCLVFLVLLGHLCEKLAAEYEMILSRLDVIVGLGEKVLLEGLEWGTSEAVNKLKKMLWGLEALRVFDDRLSASISQIQKAQDSMERTFKQEAGQQHVDLVQGHNDVLEEFEKRYGMLSDVQIRTQLKIRQVTGLRDGISVVTNVEDSKTALKQGNEISILTYITIVYLPLGFVTGLFSINEQYASFMDNANNVLYAILIVIFVLGTYALALNFGTILHQWSKFKENRQLWKEEKRRRGREKMREREPPPPSRSRSSTDIFGNCFGLRRGYEDEANISNVA